MGINLERELRARWMNMTIDERYSIVDGMYATQRTILERLTPAHYSKKEVREFVYYHMHGEKWPEDWTRS